MRQLALASASSCIPHTSARCCARCCRVRRLRHPQQRQQPLLLGRRRAQAHRGASGCGLNLQCVPLPLFCDGVVCSQDAVPTAGHTSVLRNAQFPMPPLSLTEACGLHVIHRTPRRTSLRTTARCGGARATPATRSARRSSRAGVGAAFQLVCSCSWLLLLCCWLVG